VSIDCTDVVIRKPTHFWKGWYSYKHNGPGLRYEVAVSLKGGDLVWVHGPFPCGQYTDIDIFRQSLISFLDKDERVEADDGYIGEEPMVCKTPGGFYSKSEGIDKERSRIRGRHETANARLKIFGILNQKYRHDIKDHAFVFRAVAVLTQLSIESGEPLFAL
jgi:hypothetical protein